MAALIPGIAFLNSYYAGKFPRSLTGLSPLTELALYVLWALPIDAIALRCFFSPVHGEALTTARMFLGLCGPFEANAAFVRLASGVAWWSWFVDYAAVVVASVIGGNFARAFVWTTRLDLYIPLLRMRSEWYYTLQGRIRGYPRQIIPQADILVAHPAKGTRLYAGIISSFEPTETGDIREVSLEEAKRYRESEDGTMTPKEIPGDLVVIRGSTIHNINMRYYEVEEPPVPWAARLLRKTIAVFRAFFFEEP